MRGSTWEKGNDTLSWTCLEEVFALLLKPGRSFSVKMKVFPGDQFVTCMLYSFGISWFIDSSGNRWRLI